jgi:hypothetical protein
MDMHVPSWGAPDNICLKAAQYLEIVHSGCRVDEWQGSSPLAQKGWKDQLYVVHASLCRRARGELHYDSHPEIATSLDLKLL